MGYTHYWSFKRDKSKSASESEAAHQQAVKDCTKVLKTLKKEGLRLSGYSANSAVQYGGIKANGANEDSHEDFVIREHFSQNVEQGGDFCKTARKPYDLAVVACLAVFAWRLGACFEVSSDGRASDWIDGVETARRILKRKSIVNPLGETAKVLRFKKAA